MGVQNTTIGWRACLMPLASILARFRGWTARGRLGPFGRKGGATSQRFSDSAGVDEKNARAIMAVAADERPTSGPRA